MATFREFLADTMEMAWGKTEMFSSLIFGAIAIFTAWWVHWTMGVSLTMFLLLWGHASYRAYSKAMSKVEALVRASKTVIKPEGWAALAQQFERISQNVHADWKDGKWSLDGDHPPERDKLRNLLERAGVMHFPKSADPFSEWLSLLKKESGSFHAHMFNGQEDSSQGRIPHVAQASVIQCGKLQTALLKQGS